MPRVPSSLGDPFCSQCGYQLKGLTDSSRCPECGRPLVEVLVRETARRGRRWKSAAEFAGLPLVSIAMGPAPGERFGKPVGIIAIGDFPLGVIAIGAFARGGLAIGAYTCGIIGLGGFATGLLAIGGFAVGGFTIAAFGLGLYTLGAFGACLIKGWGSRVWYLLR